MQSYDCIGFIYLFRSGNVAVWSSSFVLVFSALVNWPWLFDTTGCNFMWVVLNLAADLKCWLRLTGSQCQGSDCDCKWPSYSDSRTWLPKPGYYSFQLERGLQPISGVNIASKLNFSTRSFKFGWRVAPPLATVTSASPRAGAEQIIQNMISQGINIVCNCYHRR